MAISDIRCPICELGRIHHLIEGAEICEFHKGLYSSIKKQNEHNMKPFNLEKALAGGVVINRIGAKVVIAGHKSGANRPLAGWIEVSTGDWCCYGWFENGSFKENDELSPYDLFMEPVKKKGWVNVYPPVNSCDENSIAGLWGGSHNFVFKTEEIAKMKAGSGLIATVPIEWEE